MLKIYLVVAWRNLLKRWSYSAINILGLSMGISICMLIVLFIKSEISFDRFIPNGNSIFRIVVERKYPGRSTSYANIPRSYAAAVKAEFPEVSESTRIIDFLNGASIQYKQGNQKFDEKKVLMVDSSFFKVFRHDFMHGDPLTALHDINSAVMTESTAIKYFGSSQAAVGQILIAENQNENPIQIKAVCKDWPDNSHFDFDILLSTTGQPFLKNENFVNFQAHTYIQLNNHSLPAVLESKFPELIKKYAAGNISQAFAMSFEDFIKAGNGYVYYLQPLQKIHLISHLDSELKPNGSLQSVYIFGVIALIILLLAIVNFINLSTARSSERAREVGIRKTYGSEKTSLVLQFLIESVLTSFFSLLIALISTYLLLPSFSSFSGSTLYFKEIFKPGNFTVLLALTMCTGLLAGIYPSLILSSFKPISVLKGKFSTSPLGLSLRNGLVIFQFCISLILITCTLIVNKQMNFMLSNNLGYNKDQIIVINRADLLNEHHSAFKSQIKASTAIHSVSGASAFPGENSYFGISWRKQGDAQPITGRGLITDDQYATILDLELKEGRFFSKDFGTDSLSLVVNESAVKELGLTHPIGTTLTTEEEFLNNPGGKQNVYTIVGVIKDYNYQSLHIPITPLIALNTAKFGDQSGSIAIKLNKGKIPEGLQHVENIWKQYVKDKPVNYSFLDKAIALQYDAELKLLKIFTFFATLAIFIACLGLLGLAVYACQQRMREVAIRKVLGASVFNIMSLLSSNFIKSIGLAMIIAFPISWYVMNNWLNVFSYRIAISPVHFIIAGIVTLCIAVVTLSTQTLKSGIMNPAQTIHSN